ncbi:MULTISPECIES: hypothetical protein [unclassified Variovorax]|uniref:hypothetical protein n=1 Tax=unclassified Variovorax TaxID=663243 RepID=UPI001BD6A9F1|nr:MULTISPECIES: hypothetical protein [unclassified Variovorax]
MTKLKSVALSACLAFGFGCAFAQTGGGAAGGSPNGGPPPNTNSSAAGSVNGYKDSKPSASDSKAGGSTSDAGARTTTPIDAMNNAISKDPRVKDPNSNDGLPSRAAAGGKSTLDTK